GISRKITNAADRKKLKEIATSIEVPDGAGLIVRTAGAKRTKTEIKRDYEYLQRLWEQIRELTLKSTAPAKIYEEGDLIKRSIRDLYGKDIDEVLVEGEAGYRVAKDFMKMIMPSHAKNVKQYGDGLPLFARHQVEQYLDGMFNPTVQLKSGGYIVIGITEALVAVDVNSGRATKEGSIEETALKTNLEAAEEVARQLRLRDLAGLIVIDFIDMEDRRNNAAVEKRLKDKLKTDRARIQVGRISGFGLLEMSRQRLRPGMIEATTQDCPHCHGTGLIRSEDSLGLSILRQLEEEGTRRRSREVLVKAPVQIANFLINQKREHIAQIEAKSGLSVRIEADPFLISPDYAIEKFKTATRNVPEAPVITGDSSLMDDWEAPEAEEEATEAATPTHEEGDGAPKKKRRRRRRRRGGGGNAEAQTPDANTTDADGAAETAEASADSEATETADAPAEAAPEATDAEETPKPKRTRSRSRSRKKADVAADAPADAPAEETAAVAAEEAPVDAPAEAEPSEAAEEAPKPKPKRTRTRKKASPPAEEEAAPAVAPVAEMAAPAEDAVVEAQAEAAPETKSAVPPAPEPAPEPVAEEPAAAEADKPKKKGWWSLGR
ncbi:MAG: ribonuclease E/G, partial [Pseudomonadota bacterium]